MSKRAAATLILIAAFAVPTLSYAAVQDDLRAQIAQLLQRVTSLQTQLQHIGTNGAVVVDFDSCVAAGNAVMESYPRKCNYNGHTYVENISNGTSTSAPQCPGLSRNLWLGTSGADVSALQSFLRNAGVYTHPVITGYFGPITQAAVQRWQAQHGVVAAGTPATTGFGVVGPQTRSAFKSFCGGGSSNDGDRPTFCTLQYAPVCGQLNGEIKTYGNTCQLNAAGAQWLYEGECNNQNNTTAPNSCKIWNDGCNTCSRSYPGGPMACTLRACIWQGIPKCEAYFGDNTNPGLPDFGVMFETQPSSGRAPLTVTFNAPSGSSCVDGPDYEIDFGDGSARAKTASCNPNVTDAITHTYTQQGTYTATLYAIPSGFGTGDRTPRVAATKTITVKGAGTTACTLQYAPVCGIFRPNDGICVDGLHEGYCSGETKTFGNQCQLDNYQFEGFELLHQGEC